jgi:hypothetical protein
MHRPSSNSVDEMKTVLKGTPGLLQALAKLMKEGVLPDVQYWAILALARIDSSAAKEVKLHSARAFEGRARAYREIGGYCEALHDLNEAVESHKEISSGDLLRWVNKHSSLHFPICIISWRKSNDATF